MDGGIMKKTVFLDRDGTVMRDEGYLADPDGVRLLPGVVDALCELRKAGYSLILVTNQSGIGRGMFGECEMKRVNERLVSMCAEHGIHFDDILICPHTPSDNCDCRKPSPKLLLDAAEKHGIDLSVSAMVGDKPSDPETGLAAGCECNILLTATPARFRDKPYHIVGNLSEAAEIILREVISYDRNQQKEPGIKSFSINAN
jgi:D-glycero-D-manno-heptose 1,7-bisphosphate phosphatase